MEKRVPYRVYKKAYPTAKTIPDSYDAKTKTIVIITQDSVRHLRFSTSEWETSGNHKTLRGHRISVYSWGSGDEIHFEVEAYKTVPERGHGEFWCWQPGMGDWRYLLRTVPGYGPGARDAAITMAKELAATGEYKVG